MARTKRDLIPEENMEQDIQLSQTGPEMLQEDSLPDLELQAADTLDPDAPQTDLELYGDNACDEENPQCLQTDPESDAEPGGESYLTDDRSDWEVPQAATVDEDEPANLIHLGPGVAGEAVANDLIAAEEHPYSQTDLDDSGELEMPQPEFDSEENTRTPPARRQRRAVAESDQTADEDETDPEQPKKLRMPGRRRQRVVSIDAERTVETDTDRLRSDLLDLVESLKGKKILTGTIQGVERLADNPEMSYAVLYHGDFKVIIPVLEAIEEPEDYRDQAKGDVLHYLLNKRLGAEVDYIVKGVDQDSNVVAASRLEAMALKRREYYFRTDRDGNYQIYEGIRAEARVVSVIRAGIFVDLFGAECYIPLRELSYQRWVDAAAHYQPGQRVLVKVLSVDRSDRNRPQVTASVKQASENPYEKALKKYAVGNRYVGTVSMVDLNGVFVSLDGGIDCLCTYPRRGRPPRGARATVRILGINQENNRIWGVITHMSTTR